MLDEVIIDLRAAAGQADTSLALVAPPAVLPDEPLLPEPTEAEMVEQLFTAVDTAATPAERTSLLQTLLGLLDRAATLLPTTWAGLIRSRAEDLLGEERRLDAAYAELRTSTLAAATRSVARADVRGIERLRCSRARGRRAAGRPAAGRGGRPAGHARRAARVGAGDAARARPVGPARPGRPRLPAFGRRRRSAPSTAIPPRSQDVRAQAGPPATRLPSIIDRWRRDGLRLDRITPPADMQAVHALFRSAWAMAEQAFTLRLSAAAGNDAARAQQASSAAAGALMLLTRARRISTPRWYAAGAAHSVITPRRTRLLRVPSLRGMQDVLTGVVAELDL